MLITNQPVSIGLWVGKCRIREVAREWLIVIISEENDETLSTSINICHNIISTIRKHAERLVLLSIWSSVGDRVIAHQPCARWHVYTAVRVYADLVYATRYMYIARQTMNIALIKYFSKIFNILNSTTYLRYYIKYRILIVS